MRKKYKVTGFTRLLIFLVIFTPFAYVGGAYINGEDGIEKIKDALEINQSEAQKIKAKKDEIKILENEIKVLQREIEVLEK